MHPEFKGNLGPANSNSNILINELLFFFFTRNRSISECTLCISECRSICEYRKVLVSYFISPTITYAPTFTYAYLVNLINVNYSNQSFLFVVNVVVVVVVVVVV